MFDSSNLIGIPAAMRTGLATIYSSVTPIRDNAPAPIPLRSVNDTELILNAPGNVIATYFIVPVVAVVNKP